MSNDLVRMSHKNDSDEHTHINDIEFNHEMTVALYSNGEIASFSERIKKLITQDE